MTNDMARGVRFRYLIFLIALVVMASVVTKAIGVSVVYDEAVTYFGFALQPVSFILNFDLPTANNHVLNSLLIKFFTSYLPLGNLSLRLSSILGFLIYLIFIWLLLKKMDPPLLKVSGFILLAVQPYLCDFFSLARGYGSSIGLMVCCLYFLKRLLESDKHQSLNRILVLVLGGLSVLASFTLLNFYLMVICIVTGWGFYHPVYILECKGPQLWKKLSVNVFLSILITSFFLIIILPPLLSLRGSNELYFGGRSGVWQDTAGSLLTSMLYGISYTAGVFPFLQVFICAALLLCGIFIFRNIFRGVLLSRDNNFTNALIFIFAGVILFKVIQHKLLGVNYPRDRIALFLIPLFLLMLTFCISNLHHKGIIVAQYALFLLAILSVFHFTLSYKMKYVHEWIGDSKNAMLYLKQELAYDKAPSAIYTVWIYQPELTFYARAWDLQSLNIEMKEPKEVEGEGFWYGDAGDTTLLKRGGWEMIKEFPASNKVLLKSK